MTHLRKLAASMGLISGRYARFDQAHSGVTETMLHEQGGGFATVASGNRCYFFEVVAGF